MPLLHHVLVVEDDVVLCEMVGDFLPLFWAEHAGSQTPLALMMAHTLEEAIAILRTSPIDVIILDLALPGYHPCTTVEALSSAMRELGRVIPIVVMSGYLNRDTNEKVLTQGALECVSKGGADLFPRLVQAMNLAWARHMYIERLLAILREGE